MTGPGATPFAVVALAAALLAGLVAGGMGAVARGHLRLAAALLGALAIADLTAILDAAAQAGAFADAVSLLVVALLPPHLALAALAEERRPVRPGLAGLLLALACAGGLAAAVTALAPVAIVPLGVSAAALAGIGMRRRWRPAALLCASAAALVAAAASIGGSEGRLGVLLFLAAGLLGSVAALARRSDAPLESRPARRSGGVLIGRKD